MSYADYKCDNKDCNYIHLDFKKEHGIDFPEHLGACPKCNNGILKRYFGNQNIVTDIAQGVIDSTGIYEPGKFTPKKKIPGLVKTPGYTDGHTN